MDTIRITSGEFRGQSIKSPGSSLTHPMGAREKLALFNMISDHLPGARVLDAFAGSGALGIEALSRGAKEVVFVEKSPKVSRTVAENVKSIGLDDKSEFLTSDIENYLTKRKFDVIIADPPYDHFIAQKLFGLTDILKDGGVLALSHPTSAPEIPGLKLTKTRNYAAANLSIYLKIA